jgi:hypothetical protein
LIKIITKPNITLTTVKILMGLYLVKYEKINIKTYCANTARNETSYVKDKNTDIQNDSMIAGVVLFL